MVAAVEGEGATAEDVRYALPTYSAAIGVLCRKWGLTPRNRPFVAAAVAGAGDAEAGGGDAVPSAGVLRALLRSFHLFWGLNRLPQPSWTSFMAGRWLS